MSEDDWLHGNNIHALLELALNFDRLSERKLRLFAAACCRRIWPFIADSRSQNAVNVVEGRVKGNA